MTTPEEDKLRLEGASTATANQTAAGAVPQTGPLQADTSLPAGFQKDATGRIFAVSAKAPEPVVTSTDVAAEFDTNKAAVDERQKAIADRMAAANADKATEATATKDQAKFNEDTGRVETESDAITASLAKWEKERTDAFEAEAETRKKQYESLFATSLADIDAATAATIQNITQSYDKRLNEQRRINSLNIARVKAYGLGHGGQYTPIDFSDAVSAREQEAAAEVGRLEGERTSLLAQANAAARSGKSALLRSHMEDLDKIENNLRSNLERVQSEADKQYEVLRAYREQQEAEHKQKLEEARTRFAAIASTFLGEYDGKDQATKDALIKSIMNTTGLDYATIFGQMEKAASDAALMKDKASKDARGELRSIGGKLYQITYDANGKPKSTLVQGGGGGSGSGSSDYKLTASDKNKMIAEGLDPNNPEDRKKWGDEHYGNGGGEVLSYQDFEKLASETTDENGNPLYTQSGPELKKKYDEYLKEANAGKQKKDLTPTDRKKMAAAGLDPENPEDIDKYIKDEYDPLK